VTGVQTCALPISVKSSSYMAVSVKSSSYMAVSVKSSSTIELAYVFN
jgi:hypothetical protein